MINLLPPKAKKEIKAARSNRLMLRYVLLMVGAVVFLVGALFVTHWFLDGASEHARETQAENEQRAAGYTEVQAEAEQFRSQLSQTRSLLDEELRYSLALVRISNLLPSGTALEQLELTPTSFSEPTTFNVLITGESAAYQLRSSFNESEYLSDVSLGELRVNQEDSTYPYTLDITATISREIAQ